LKQQQGKNKEVKNRKKITGKNCLLFFCGDITCSDIGKNRLWHNFEKTIDFQIFTERR
jgi:hypothetical protein